MKSPDGLSSGDAQQRELLRRLRAGDADAFAMLVDVLSPSLLRVARMHVPSHAVAEEVVQDTWIGVLRGLDGFEGRASVKTWIFRILLNQAKTRGVKEQRTVPFASLVEREVDEPFAAVDPSRFLPADHEQWPRHWATPVPRWDESPEHQLESSETMRVIRAALDELPPAQRTVMTLRDIDGLDADEVCQALDISQGNQRVLLHRARSRVRSALERHLAA